MDNSFDFNFEEVEDKKPLITEKKEDEKTEIKETQKTCYIIDAYAMIYRAYYAFMNNKLTDKDGMNISCVHGFFNTISMLFKNYKVDYLAVAFDTRGPTFRHVKYKEYKANRSAAPEDLHPQVPIIKDILKESNIAYYEQDDVEADDIIAALTDKCIKEDILPIVVTGDKDLLQLVSSKSYALRPPKPKTSSWRLFGVKEVKEEFSVSPKQILDYLAIIGDSSDNVPGVKGLGPKGAVKLISEYGDLDTIYKHLDQYSKGVKQKLTDSKDLAYLSYDLVSLRPDLVKCDLNIENMDGFDLQKASDKLMALDLKSVAHNISPNSATKIVEKKKIYNNEKGKYEAITSKEKLKFLFGQIKKNKLVSFDTETTSTNALDAKLIGFSFSYQSKRAYYVPLNDDKEIIKLLKDLLEDKNIAIIGQNIKYDYKVLKANYDITIANIYFDTMVAAYVLDASSKRYNMDFLAEKYLGYETIKFTDIVENGQDFSSVELEKAKDYASEDADITLRLYNEFEIMLKEKELSKVFYELDMPLVKILAEMEIEGVYLDKDYTNELGKKLLVKRSEIEKKIYTRAGKEFNINSTVQLGQVLFEDLGIKSTKKTTTKRYSTSDAVLQEIDDEIAEFVRDYRENNKLLNTYITPMVELCDENSRIHTHYKQTGTETGRLSSIDPNLQNIPIRKETGRLVRSAFKASEGKVLVSSDYSQIELVVLSHLSGDKNLQEAFISGKDIHSFTASLIFDKDLKEVSREERSIAKTINFGVLYGMSAFRLAKDLKISRFDAQDFIDAYFSRYSQIKHFMNKVLDNARIDGYVSTLFGRRRDIKDINSKNGNIKNAAERMAINTVVQGTASDILKIAMININKALKKKNLKSKLLLQVHDELIFEAPISEEETLKALVKEEMMNAYKLDVPLKVGIESAKSWGEMH